MWFCKRTSRDDFLTVEQIAVFGRSVGFVSSRQNRNRQLHRLLNREAHKCTMMNKQNEFMCATNKQITHLAVPFGSDDHDE